MIQLPQMPAGLCGKTSSITSEDYTSCEFAYCSFVFACLTGVTIGAISISNIIGVAYVQKRASVLWLVTVTCIFEGIGMLTMSRFTLNETITATVDINKIHNLRLGFIALGSTQMCSSLILVNVLIFALPMSTTQVVISGLTGISLIFFVGLDIKYEWFLFEVLMWVFVPIGGLVLSYLMYKLIHRYIFNSIRARQRIICFLPYQMMLSTYICLMAAMLKNHLYTNANHDQEQSSFLSSFFSIEAVIIAAVGYPIIMLPTCRYYVLRKARGLTYQRVGPKLIHTINARQDTLESVDESSVRRKNSKLTDVKIEQPESHYWTDIKSALKFWSNQPLLDAYFVQGSQNPKSDGQAKTVQIHDENDQLQSDEIQEEDAATKKQDQRLRVEKEIQMSLSKIDKMFEIPLLISVCMLAMAHGSNEINVAAPLAAQLFLLNGNQTNVSDEQQFTAIMIGLVSVLLGTVLLGQRLLYKYRKNFMKTTIANGFIANTSVSIMLFVASSLNFTVSSTYILMPCLFMLQHLESGKKGLNYWKPMKAIVFAVFITVFSMAMSVGMSWLLLYLDYEGPNHQQNDVYHRANDTNTTLFGVFTEL